MREMFVLCVVVAAVSILACAPPPISELIKNGVDCKADIEMPEAYAGEKVTTKVKIYDCKEVSAVAGK